MHFKLSMAYNIDNDDKRKITIYLLGFRYVKIFINLGISKVKILYEQNYLWIVIFECSVRGHVFDDVAKQRIHFVPSEMLQWVLNPDFCAQDVTLKLCNDKMRQG